MRYHQCGFAALADLGNKHLHDLLSARGVKVRSRLVDENERRIVHQCAADGDPLALAPGHLRRVGVSPAGQAQFVDQPVRAVGGNPAVKAAYLGDSEQVLARREVRQQVVALKDEADLPAAKARKLCRLQRGQLLTSDADAPG